MILKNKPIKHKPFPSAIEIQTASYCNGGCLICPYKDVFKKFGTGIMKMDLFKKIIDQVPDSKKVRLIPYFNNEPFLDPLIFKRLKYIRKKCPKAEIEISTNMGVFDKSKQDRLKNIMVDDLRLSVFGFIKKEYEEVMTWLKWENTKKNLDSLVNNLSLRKNIKKISLIMIDYPKLSKESKYLAKKYCKDNNLKFNFWGFMDRGGNVKKFSNNIKKKKIFGCEQKRPLERLHITFTGKILLCSMDWQQKYVLGDLNRQSIEKIWHSPKYLKIRKHIYSGSKNSPRLCQKCKLSLT